MIEFFSHVIFREHTQQITETNDMGTRQFRMPAKTKKKKSKTKSKTAAIDIPQFDYTPPQEDKEWVILDIRLIAWTYLDFTFAITTLHSAFILPYIPIIRFETSIKTKLFTVIDKIKEQHNNSIQDIQLFRETRTPKTEMKDQFKSLEEYGIEGGPKDAPSKVKILYDFKADHIAQSPDVFFSSKDVPDRKSTFI